MVRRLTYIILLVAGVLVVGSESENFISNIIGLAMLCVSGYNLNLFYHGKGIENR